MLNRHAALRVCAWHTSCPGLARVRSPMILGSRAYVSVSHVWMEKPRPTSRFLRRGKGERASAVAHSPSSTALNSDVRRDDAQQSAAAPVTASAETKVHSMAAEPQTRAPSESPSNSQSQAASAADSETTVATEETLSAESQTGPNAGGNPASSPPPPNATSAPPPHAPPSGGLQRLFASWQQGVVASIGAVMGIGFIVYLLYTPVKEDTVHHTAVVASEALGDIRLKGKAVELSKTVVFNVLQDEKTLQLVVQLVRQLLAQDDTRIAVSSLLQSLFEDHYTQEVTKKFVLMIVRDPWIMDQLQVVAKEQVLRLLQDEAVQAALSSFLTASATQSLQEPHMVHETARAIRRSVVAIVNPWK